MWTCVVNFAENGGLHVSKERRSFKPLPWCVTRPPMSWCHIWLPIMENGKREIQLTRRLLVGITTSLTVVAIASIWFFLAMCDRDCRDYPECRLLVLVKYAENGVLHAIRLPLWKSI